LTAARSVALDSPALKARQQLEQLLLLSKLAIEPALRTLGIMFVDMQIM